MAETDAENVDRVTLNKEMRDEIHTLNERIDAMRDKHDAEMNAIKLRYDTIIETMSQKHDIAIDSLKDKNNLFFLENGKLQLKINAMEAQISFLKDQVPEASTRVFDNFTEHYERPKERNSASLG